MSHNPYAPPTAPVADISNRLAQDDSRDVKRACRLLWVSYGVSALATIADVLRFPDYVGPIIVGSIVGLAVGFLITRWFVSRLMARRNWMRVFLASCSVLFVLLALFFRDRVMSRYASSLPRAVAFGAELIVSTLAILLLFTSRWRSWFAAGPSKEGEAVCLDN